MPLDCEVAIRIGVLGGTFDPVHNAHLAMARAALEHLQLHKVLWIPTGNPGYRPGPIASAEDRVAMLKLALAGEPRYQIDERELDAGATGYTVDTLRALHAEMPQAQLYLLIGADQYEKFNEWRSPQEIQRLARVAVFPRPGHRIEGEVLLVPMPAMPHAATDIRRSGVDAKAQVPPAVANYIASKGLYR